VRLLKALAAALIASGCAGATTNTTRTEAPGAPTREVYTGDGAHVTLAPSTYTVETDLGASAEDAWTAAVATYEELGIEVTYSRPGEEVGNRQFRVRRRLAGDRLSKYLRCGVDATGRPMADSYVVTLNVVSEVTGVTDLQSRMGTTVSATALKPGGTSTAPVVCASKGLLEERIAELVVGRVH
jgi:hypothetical protein